MKRVEYKGISCVWSDDDLNFWQWYEKYVGYCFTDNGQEVILEDVFRYENGKTGYQLYCPATNKRVLVDYQEFMRVRKQTDLPR